MPLSVSCRADDAVKHEFDVNSLLFHQGKLYSGADDGKVKVWEADLRFVAEAQAHPCSVFGVAASENTLYSCSNEGTVKSWDLNTLKARETLFTESDVEFWKIRYSDGVLYAGDSVGNVRLFKQDKFYGQINVAEPVKDLVVVKNLLFTVKDNDVVVTDLHLGGEKPQFGVKATLAGRGPLALSNNNIIYISREGKDIVVGGITAEQHVTEVSKVAGAHDMIINALATSTIDGKNYLFSAGWDKVVKQWRIDANHQLTLESSVNVDIVVNALTEGEAGLIYAAGSDGHIVRVNV